MIPSSQLARGARNPARKTPPIAGVWMKYANMNWVTMSSPFGDRERDRAPDDEQHRHPERLRPDRDVRQRGEIATDVQRAEREAERLPEADACGTRARGRRGGLGLWGRPVLDRVVGVQRLLGQVVLGAVSTPGVGAGGPLGAGHGLSWVPVRCGGGAKS